MEAFPLLDENQAEIMLLDCTGLLIILSCDFLNQDDPSSGFAIMRELMMQDIDLSNGSAMTACR